jgi:hypothetical protein
VAGSIDSDRAGRGEVVRVAPVDRTGRWRSRCLGFQVVPPGGSRIRPPQDRPTPTAAAPAMEGQARRSEPLKQQPFTTPITIPSGLMETPWPQNAGRAAHRVLVKGNGVEAFSRLAAHAPITPTVLEKEIGGRDDQRVWFTFPRASYSVRWAGRSSAFYRPGGERPVGGGPLSRPDQVRRVPSEKSRATSRSAPLIGR